MNKKTLLIITILLVLLVGAATLLYQNVQKKNSELDKVKEMIEAVNYAIGLKFTFDYNQLKLIEDIKNNNTQFEGYLFVEKNDMQQTAENILVFRATDKTEIIVSNLNYYLKRFPENATEKYSENSLVTIKDTIVNREDLIELLNNFSQAELNLIFDTSIKL